MLGKEKVIYRVFSLVIPTMVLVLLGVSGMIHAPIVVWNEDVDWDSGTHHETQNSSGDLLLNQTLGDYAMSGHYVSTTTVSDNPVSELVPVWQSTEPNENVNLSVELSVNGGSGWCVASNNTEMNLSVCPLAGFKSGYDIVFRVNLSTNDTSQTPRMHTLSLDYTELTPYLEVNLVTPYDDTIVGQNKTIVVNMTLYCRDGNCGNVNGTLRYNKSSPVPDDAVSTVAGDVPFYIIDAVNTKNCSTNPLVRDEYCNLTWTINATGSLSEEYEIDVLLKSNRTASNNTEDSTIEIGKILIIDLEFSQINFGILDPGSENQPADGNSYGYNISVNVNSDDVEHLWVKGTNLTNDDSDSLDCDVYEQYSPYEGNTTNYPCLIGVENVIWSLESDPAADQKYNLSGNYERVNKDFHIIPAGDVETTYYWIDVPYGIYAGSYTGTVTFMANVTW